MEMCKDASPFMLWAEDPLVAPTDLSLLWNVMSASLLGLDFFLEGLHVAFQPLDRGLQCLFASCQT